MMRGEHIMKYKPLPTIRQKLRRWVLVKLYRLAVNYYDITNHKWANKISDDLADKIIFGGVNDMRTMINMTILLSRLGLNG